MEGGELAKYLITFIATVDADDMGQAFNHAIRLSESVSLRHNIKASALDIQEIDQDEADNIMSGL
jgi:hypothetical protein